MINRKQTMLPLDVHKSSFILNLAAMRLLALAASVRAFSFESPSRISTSLLSTELHVVRRNPAKDFDESHAAATRLGFRDGIEDFGSVVSEKQDRSHWWETIFAVPGSGSEPRENEQQAIVDDYLEFLDRRYRRLKDDHSKAKEPTFSAWRWLTSGIQVEDLEVTSRQNDDALYALGVAGLASQRLLQKHHLSVSTVRALELPEISRSRSIVVEVPMAVSTNARKSDRMESFASILAMRVAPIIHQLATLRRKICCLEAHKVKQAATLALTIIARGPRRLARKLWKLGGGTDNVLWTASVLAAVFVLFLRPLTQAILLESATSGRAL